MIVKDALSCQQYAVSVMGKETSTENLRNDLDRGKQKYSDENLSHQTVVHWPRNETWFPRSDAGY
jgi:hypothetical protein